MLKRLGTLDRTLLLTLVPLWCACFGLQLVVGFSGSNVTFAPSFQVAPAESEEAYPTIIASEAPEMAVGDRILRVGDQNLRGVTSPVGVRAIFWNPPLGADRRSSKLLLSRGGLPFEIEARVRPSPMWWSTIPFTLGLVVVGVLVLLGAPSWPLSRLAFCLKLAIAFAFTPFTAVGSGPVSLVYVTLAIHSLSFPLAWAFALRFAFLFPNRRPPLGRWETLLPWFFGVGVALDSLLWFWTYWPWWWGNADNAIYHGVATIAVIFLWAVTRNYRGTDLLGRRQIKWIIYGFYIGFAPAILVVLANLMGLLGEEKIGVAIAVVQLALAAIPAGVLVSVFWSRFLDIDPFVSAAASYSVLSILVLAGVFVLIPAVAGAAGTALGVDHDSARLGLSVALAGVAVPIHRSLRPRIHGFFFPERHALDEGIHHLLNELSSDRDPRSLTTLVGEQLDTQFRPDSCVVYSRTGHGFEPVFARGRAVPPAIEAASPLVTTLQARTAPLASDRFSRNDRIEQLSLFERATLDTLGVAVVVPVRRRGDLVAFLCLGPKRSGDIYTSTDLALLTAVAVAVSSQLDRFEDAQIISDGRSMQQELRRYVPGAVARELEEGADLEPRERPVSILFVDIQDYTLYSERHQAHEVFTTINRYTQAVSSVVEKFGGSVVEFNGDGMMAVFGAPTVLPDKERAAVSAGREIITKVLGLGGAIESERISVGVGVATGSAFVGSIQAVDRMIWTALGNTTNLAARLQGLTRNLDSAMVIDLATRRAAGDVASDFQRRDQVTIRGRSEKEDLYLLALDSSASA